MIGGWLGLFVVVTVLFFFFGATRVSIFGAMVPVLLPSVDSVSIQFFQKMQEDVLPDDVTLVAMTPFSALNTQITVAALLSFLVTFPFLVFRLVGYVSPALYTAERRALLGVLLPGLFLFLGGAFFAYSIVIPPTFKALYSYTEGTGVPALFSIDAFVAFVMTFMLVTGVLFLLPILMALLSFFGIIPPLFWRTHWRYALFTFLIFSAIITPDGSGVGMMLLSLPLGGLYAAGAGVASLRKPFALAKIDH